eukprot:m.144555 g.144555  ORF g.144555 m.144555 type:complete len:387 (+) comp16200_c0_seq2:105-1265(+)
MAAKPSQRRDTLPPRPSKPPGKPPAYRSRYSVSQARVPLPSRPPAVVLSSSPSDEDDKLRYLHEFRQRAHSKVLISRGRVSEEVVDTLSELPSDDRMLVLTAVKLGVLTQDQAFAHARQLLALRQSAGDEAATALASLQQDLETQCAEARRNPIVPAAAKPVSSAPDDIDSLDNTQRRAVMESVANGALPATEALGLMEQYLDVELGRRPLTAEEVGRGLDLTKDSGADPNNGGQSPAGGRRRRTLFSGLRRSSTASDKPKPQRRETITSHGSEAEPDFYSAAAGLDDEQRKAVMQSVANGSLSQSEALELVRQFIAVSQPEGDEPATVAIPDDAKQPPTPTTSRREVPSKHSNGMSSDEEAPLLEETDYYTSDSSDESHDYLDVL